MQKRWSKRLPDRKRISFGEIEFKKNYSSLPEQVMVYPGHNDLTCIADEKQYNPFI